MNYNTQIESHMLESDDSLFNICCEQTICHKRHTGMASLLSSFDGVLFDDDNSE